MSKVLLITGATGKQGGAAINALLASPRASEFTILAVTRNTASSGAQKLSQKTANLRLVQGDLNDCPAIFESARKQVDQPVWGVFSVQLPFGSGQDFASEERQGKALIDASLKNGVEHFVYTSVDRGGDKSYEDPTYVPHFASKHNIEHHLADSTKGTNMSWTILRPVAFFENIVPGMQGKVFIATVHQRMKGKPLLFVSTADVGHFAAAAFLDPGRNNNRAISLAGDRLTYEQMRTVFLEKTGQEQPESYSFFSTLLMWAIKEMPIMFKWFYEVQYDVDIKALREEYPGLTDYGTYLERSSGFKVKESTKASG